MNRKTEGRELAFGPVWIAAGPHEGQIGFYDDDHRSGRNHDKAMVYFGEPMLASRYFLIPYERMSRVTHRLLKRRRDELVSAVATWRRPTLKGRSRISALEELILVLGLLAGRGPLTPARAVRAESLRET